ncbi:MAG TPA: hypothetical protein DD381_11710 [Lentisphaeria bacterium]|nr:MAG: hypothetical protein A2X47_09020 [Lentisphaerae bacterium GWF2_38_69]HBM16993.1 hypothetical protein [Lentisphaeria bacterium]
MKSGTLLHRQVHPGFIQNGKISSQAFRPTPKDENKLSVYNGDMITAEKAYYHFCKQLNYSSAGVMSVTQAECASQSLPIGEDKIPFPEHCHINFEGLAKSQIEKKAKFLKNYAESRGWQFRPE